MCTLGPRARNGPASHPGAPGRGLRASAWHSRKSAGPAPASPTASLRDSPAVLELLCCRPLAPAAGHLGREHLPSCPGSQPALATVPALTQSLASRAALHPELPAQLSLQPLGTACKRLVLSGLFLTLPAWLGKGRAADRAAGSESGDEPPRVTPELEGAEPALSFHLRHLSCGKGHAHRGPCSPEPQLGDASPGPGTGDS